MKHKFSNVFSRIMLCVFTGLVQIAIALPVRAAADPPEKMWFHFDAASAEQLEFKDATGDWRCRIEQIFPLIDGGWVSRFNQDVICENPKTGPEKTELTIAAWIVPVMKPQGDAYRYQTICFWGKRGEDYAQWVGLMLNLHDGRPEFKFTNADGKWEGMIFENGSYRDSRSAIAKIENPAEVKIGAWNHVAATFSHGRIVLYLNGLEVASGMSAPRILPGQAPLRLGLSMNSMGCSTYEFVGLLDDVRGYDRTLSGAEIQALSKQKHQSGQSVALNKPLFLENNSDPGFSRELKLVSEYRKPLPAKTEKMGNCASKIESDAGTLKLYVNGQAIPPLSMMASPWKGEEKTLGKVYTDFAAAGVKVYLLALHPDICKPGEANFRCSNWWVGPGEYDFTRVDAELAAVLAANPDAYIMVRIKVIAPRWWKRAHPDEVEQMAMKTKSGDVDTLTSKASLASRMWQTDSERMLRDLVIHLENGPYASRIIGYLPGGGGSSEWYWSHDSNNLSDYSPAATARFRDWLRERYHGNIASLRKAWNTAAVDFSTAQVPSQAARYASENGFFRDPHLAGAAIDYRRFMTDVTIQSILGCCKVIKEASKRKKLVGTFYGYAMDTWSYQRRLIGSGFLGTHTLLSSPEVDFLASPLDYNLRKGGESGTYITTCTASIRLHQKMYWEEIDHMTHLDFPKFRYWALNSPSETVNVLRRSFGYSLTKNAGLWWFLIDYNFSYHQDEVMNEIADEMSLANRNINVSQASAAEIAVLVDEESMLYTNNYTTGLNFRLTWKTNDELHRMGAPFDMYLIDDLKRPDFPSYKVYIFLNVFALTEAKQRAINDKIKRNHQVAVWVYAPGYLSENGFSLKAMQKLTGIGFEQAASSPAPDTIQTLAVKDSPLTLPAAAGTPVITGNVSPFFFVNDPGAQIMAKVETYPTVAVKRFPEWTSIYFALPLTREWLQGICRYAGIHVYSTDYDVCFANRSYLMLHASQPGRKEISLPAGLTAEDLFTGEQMTMKDQKFSVEMPIKTTRLFKLSPQQKGTAK